MNLFATDDEIDRDLDLDAILPAMNKLDRTLAKFEAATSRLGPTDLELAALLPSLEALERRCDRLLTTCSTAVRTLQRHAGQESGAVEKRGQPLAEKSQDDNWLSERWREADWFFGRHTSGDWQFTIRTEGSLGTHERVVRAATEQKCHEIREQFRRTYPHLFTVGCDNGRGCQVGPVAKRKSCGCGSGGKCCC